MRAEYIFTSESNPDAALISKCAQTLINGGIAVFPTETVYGVGANVFDSKAVERLYEAKCRPKDKALLCHLYSVEQADEIAYLDEKAKLLIKAFTPGPLTVIARKKPIIGDNVTSGMNTVGLRFPSNPVFAILAKQCGFPIAATSANISGEDAAVSGKRAFEVLGDRVDAVIDTGETAVGVPSTILSLADEKPVILREGVITRQMIEEVIGEW